MTAMNGRERLDTYKPSKEQGRVGYIVRKKLCPSERFKSYLVFTHMGWDNAVQVTKANWDEFKKAGYTVKPDYVAFPG